jgi:hypothetical protein
MPSASEVSVEVLNGSRWTKASTAKADAAGRAVVPLKVGAGSPGDHAWRLVGTSWWGIETQSRQFTLSRVANQVSLLSAPNAAAVGQAVTIRAKVAATGAGQKVSTQFLVNGAWSTSQSATTDASGTVSLPLTYGQNSPGTYQWRLISVDGSLTSTTGAYSLTRVANSLVLLSAPSAAKAGQAVTVKAKVGGVGAGRNVSLQVLVNGKWSTSQTRATDSSGVATIPFTYAASSVGKTSWRLTTTCDGVTSSTGTYVLTRTR